jgi:nitroreductase
MSEARVTRRGVIGGVGVGLIATAAQADERKAEMTVAEALMKRHSTRQFAARDVDAATRSRVLWAAVGLNRPEQGGHTAPSWRGAADTLVHVADKAGVGLYDPATNTEQSVLTQDIRPLLSTQPFVRTAPMCLILISDLDRLTAAAGAPLSAEEQSLNAHVDSAIVAQNVYLICAALGLGTCLVGGADVPAIASALETGANRMVTYVQPIGWPV